MRWLICCIGVGMVYADVDLHVLKLQRDCLYLQTEDVQEIKPLDQIFHSGSKLRRKQGFELVKKGKVACLIVAGGQGSRLQFSKPKGLYPVTPISGKSLFQLFAERLKALGSCCEKDPYLAVMTSLGNHEETVLAFKEHEFYGLDPDKVSFFSQKDLPFLDERGNVLDLDGPDGNGSALHHLFFSGIWNIWKLAGVELVHYMHIDNALADPIDIELAGFHIEQKSQIAVKCILREDPFEKVGIYVKKASKPVVVEYSEVSLEEATAKVDGKLKHPCANIGSYSFDIDFIKQVATNHYDQMPFHKAWKKINGREGWKFEKFIFDVFPFAEKIDFLLYPRDECFAPLKNSEGSDSIVSVQKALRKKEEAIFEKIYHEKMGADVELDLNQIDYFQVLDIGD